ncbi:tryptophan synthase subunit beta, partial [Patescibacteria group bacterium]|nr:tryptophan synthase subunit beta [Patescibacteria group bacterium]
EQKRVKFTYAKDEEVLESYKLLAKHEGILAAMESSHAITEVIKLAPKLGKNKIVVVNLSGRGDKDLFIVTKAFKDKGFKEYLRNECAGDGFRGKLGNVC